MAVHYPCSVTVTDATGQLLIEQAFATPFARPAVQVVAEKDWTVPVTVTFTDAAGTAASEQLDNVTVKKHVEDTHVQLGIGDYLGDEWES